MATAFVSDDGIHQEDGKYDPGQKKTSPLLSFCNVNFTAKPYTEKIGSSMDILIFRNKLNWT